MVRCFYGSSRPNHDGDFPPSSDDSAARWGGSTDGHPSHPHRRDNSDAGSRWNGPKPSDIGLEADTSARQHDAPSQTMGKAASHIIPPLWGGSMDGHPPNLHRQHLADAEHRWNGPNPPEIGHEANNSSQRHDAPFQTNKVEAALHIIPPSPPRRATRFAPKTPQGQGGSSQRHPIEGRTQAAINNESLPITRPIEKDGGWNKLHYIVTSPREQVQCSRVPDADNNRICNLNGCICERTRQLGNATNICKIHNLAKKGRMGRAIEQFALLRRCFYPKRDVIKWRGNWNMRLSCEVSDTVQEPLKRLPFEANSTCVELPYATTMWWFGMVIEDLPRQVRICHWESMCIPCMHVHQIEGTYFALSRDPIPGVSGAWLIAGV
jgi:hypothetical protein